ncbi:MAG: ABC transporter ATP-binding protein [Kiritimatiellae bacterium]|nr:ABC transporter ATP-binding protein [Kiritimatiellia bacterium]
MNENEVLRAEGIRKSFRLGKSKSAVEVLKGVDFALCQGETVAITGASGAGKSTLLYALAGLEKPDAGEVRYAGRSLYRMGANARAALRVKEIGFVFQAYHLLPELTVLENAMLPALALPGAWKRGKELRERASALLARVGLAAREKHRPGELSGGEQQRAAIARALVNAPRLIFADEPTGNLDSASGEEVLRLLFGEVAAAGLTLLMVTHNDAVAARCDRHVKMMDGRIVP